MDYFNIGLGIFFVVLGFLVRKYPNLIAGYNTMSEAQKKTVDIDGLSTFMRNVLIGMGILIAISNLILTPLGLQDYVGTAFTFIVLAGTLYLFINAQTFQDRSYAPRSKKIVRIIITMVFFGSLVFVVARMIYRGTSSPEFEIQGSEITVSGMYGLTTNYLQIEILDELPAVKMKLNGFNFGPTLKGRFDLEGIGKCDLFVETREGPYILIITGEEAPVIINTGSEATTLELADKLRSQLTE